MVLDSAFDSDSVAVFDSHSKKARAHGPDSAPAFTYSSDWYAAIDGNSLVGSALSFTPRSFDIWTTEIALSKTTTSGFVYSMSFTSFLFEIHPQLRKLFTSK